MFKRMLTALLALTLSFLPAQGETGAIAHRFSDAGETAALLRSHEAYYAGFNQEDLNYRLQKKDGALEELLDFAAAQAEDFSDGDKAAVDDAMDFIAGRCAEMGYVLPPMDEIVFARTTMKEECDAGGYTHENQIFLNGQVLSFGLSEDENSRMWFRKLVAHELFHCLTRANPEFRAAMYAVLGFTVEPEDYVFGPEIQARIISNPDVAHHDAHAAFLIDGKWRECVLVFLAGKPFEAAGDSFFDGMTTGLVPVDDLSKLYTSEDAENFWQVFGENTDYVIDPEETLADNFALTILYGPDGRDYPTPGIIEAIDALLRP